MVPHVQPHRRPVDVKMRYQYSPGRATAISASSWWCRRVIICPTIMKHSSTRGIGSTRAQWRCSRVSASMRRSHRYGNPLQGGRFGVEMQRELSLDPSGWRTLRQCAAGKSDIQTCREWISHDTRKMGPGTSTTGHN
jgi:hypothetical protein